MRKGCFRDGDGFGDFDGGFNVGRLAYHFGMEKMVMDVQYFQNPEKMKAAKLAAICKIMARDAVKLWVEQRAMADRPMDPDLLGQMAQRLHEVMKAMGCTELVIGDDFKVSLNIP